MKIIAFIDPAKFAFLFDNVNNGLPNFKTKGDDQTIYLADNTHLVYLYSGNIEITDYNESKFDNALVVLIPDNFKLQYSFKADFKVLYHTLTIEKYSETITQLRRDKFFNGEKKSIEEKTEGDEVTLYNKIADLIVSGITTEGVKRIYSEIPLFNSLLEAKLNLLHDCLTPAGAKKADVTSLTDQQKNIVQFLGTHKDNLTKEYIEKLTELRILLLGS